MLIWPLFRFVKFFIGILVQTMTLKGHFEINWPLVRSKNQMFCWNSYQNKKQPTSPFITYYCRFFDKVTNFLASCHFVTFSWYIKRKQLIFLFVQAGTYVCRPLCMVIESVILQYSPHVRQNHSTFLVPTLDSGIDVAPGINVAPPLKNFHITILTLFYINLGIAVIFDFIFSSIFFKN